MPTKTGKEGAMNRAMWIFGWGLVAGLFLSGWVCAAPPTTVNIRGQLLDAQGHALMGYRDYRVQFYNAAMGGTALGAPLAGTAELSAEGLFNIVIDLPPEVLSSAAAWYEVAISSGAIPAPLTPQDV